MESEVITLQKYSNNNDTDFLFIGFNILVTENVCAGELLFKEKEKKNVSNFITKEIESLVILNNSSALPYPTSLHYSMNLKQTQRMSMETWECPTNKHFKNK